MPSADDVLRALASGETARPRLTHYDDSGRIELSGRVLTNWVSKAANLLQEEFDVGVGSRVVLDLPPTHWRAAYWALATWAVGATLVTDRPHDAADVVVTDQVRDDDRGELVVVTLAALARRSPHAMPDGAVDEAAVLSTYGDVLDPWGTATSHDLAWIGSVDLPFATLVPDPIAPAERVLITATAERDWARLRTAMSVWAGDGSVVVATEHDALERIASDEAITRRV